MARKPTKTFDEADLKKGEIRILEALRKSLGPDIADKAFAEWLANRPGPEQIMGDPAADKIADEVMRLVEKHGISIPRGGYLVRRGCQRVIIEHTQSD